MKKLAEVGKVTELESVQNRAPEGYRSSEARGEHNVYSPIGEIELTKKKRRQPKDTEMDSMAVRVKWLLMRL